jgi:hypothetical protein
MAKTVVGKRFLRFYSPADGEWVRPIHRGYLLSCCDCGLVHRMNFRVVEGKVEFQAFRHIGATKLMRMTRARRSGFTCLCGAQIESQKRKKLAKRKKAIRGEGGLGRDTRCRMRQMRYLEPNRVNTVHRQRGARPA